MCGYWIWLAKLVRGGGSRTDKYTRRRRLANKVFYLQTHMLTGAVFFLVRIVIQLAACWQGAIWLAKWCWAVRRISTRGGRGEEDKEEEKGGKGRIQKAPPALPPPSELPGEGKLAHHTTTAAV